MFWPMVSRIAASAAFFTVSCFGPSGSLRSIGSRIANRYFSTSSMMPLHDRLDLDDVLVAGQHQAFIVEVVDAG